jgi:hypothetical protein
MPFILQMPCVCYAKMQHHIQKCVHLALPPSAITATTAVCKRALQQKLPYPERGSVHYLVRASLRSNDVRYLRR